MNDFLAYPIFAGTTIIIWEIWKWGVRWIFKNSVNGKEVKK